MSDCRQIFVVAATLLLPAASAFAADPPAPGDVLTKLHESNLKEIEMGKMAQKNGTSKDTKAFGKMLVTDHTAAEKKVKTLAKKEKVDLAKEAPAMKHDDLGTGPEFDKKFAQAMLDDHKKDVEEAKTARDAATDPKLKGLLTDIVPVLEKHQETAQKLVDASKTEAK
jgi:putative membrane protein